MKQSLWPWIVLNVKDTSLFPEEGWFSKYLSTWPFAGTLLLSDSLVLFFPCSHHLTYVIIRSWSIFISTKAPLAGETCIAKGFYISLCALTVSIVAFLFVKVAAVRDYYMRHLWPFNVLLPLHLIYCCFSSLSKCVHTIQVFIVQMAIVPHFWLFPFGTQVSFLRVPLRKLVCQYRNIVVCYAYRR